ncbi:kinase-like domain-containing protein [Mycena haematopus]|nr:kinase-like domain-containing protein [Mycena haematopus]
MDCMGLEIYGGESIFGWRCAEAEAEAARRKTREVGRRKSFGVSAADDLADCANYPSRPLPRVRPLAAVRRIDTDRSPLTPVAPPRKDHGGRLAVLRCGTGTDVGGGGGRGWGCMGAGPFACIYETAYHHVFVAEVQRLNKEDMNLKDESNLFNNLEGCVVGASVLHHLYRKPPFGDVYVAIHDVPDTLSGNILRLRASVPWESISGNSEIRGDKILAIPPNTPTIAITPFDDEDDGADLNEQTIDLVRGLPLIEAKELGLPHIVPVLGRTEDHKIVFPKLCEGLILAHHTVGIAAVKRILLQIVEALISLHDIGIIHRDLSVRNILGSSDYQTAYLCDLECFLGSWECPEIAGADGVEGSALGAAPAYSEKSDVYMFGRTMTDFILRNNTRTRWQGIAGGNWLPPAPFRHIVIACVQTDPSVRPNMREVKALLEVIPTPGIRQQVINFGTKQFPTPVSSRKSTTNLPFTGISLLSTMPFFPPLYRPIYFPFLFSDLFSPPSFYWPPLPLAASTSYVLK